MTATEENVVRPPAKPGISARRISSEVLNRYAINPATITPKVFEIKIAEGYLVIDSVRRYLVREPSAPPIATARRFFTPA